MENHGQNAHFAGTKMMTQETNKKEQTAKPTIHSRFSLGRLVSTPAALQELDASELIVFVQRHAACDWGDCCEHDILPITMPCLAAHSCSPYIARSRVRKFGLLPKLTAARPAFCFHQTIEASRWGDRPALPLYNPMATFIRAYALQPAIGL